MASGGGKNAIMLIVAVAAIGGAIYLIMNSGPPPSAQDEAMRHWIDPTTVNDDPQVTISMTHKEYESKRKGLLHPDAEVDERLRKAGICNKCDKFFELVGHGEAPDVCPVCGENPED